MRQLLMAGAAATALGTAGSASAQFLGIDPGNLYVAGEVGLHAADTFEGESLTQNATDGAPYQWDFEPGENDYLYLLRLGYRISPNWRVEIEGGYRPEDEIRSVGGSTSRPEPRGLCRVGTTTSCPPPNGEYDASSLMFNVLYDFFDEDARFRPFVGVGIGAVQVDNEVRGRLSGVAVGAAPQQEVNFDDNEQSFGYQGILGASYGLTDRLSLEVIGRYLAADDFSFGSRTTNVGPPGGAVTPVGVFEGDYRNLSLTAGLRYQFGGTSQPIANVSYVPPPLPPTPPPPAPMPEPMAAPAPVSQEFVVYFPFDQSVLTPEAQSVIQQAAAYAQSGAATSIVVVGHADTSGSQAYNVRLSERRSKAVADSLVSLGVAQTALQVDWRGETQPAVPTGDGVKEPLNRRTTIGINF